MCEVEFFWEVCVPKGKNEGLFDKQRPKCLLTNCQVADLGVYISNILRFTKLLKNYSAAISRK